MRGWGCYILLFALLLGLYLLVRLVEVLNQAIGPWGLLLVAVALVLGVRFFGRWLVGATFKRIFLLPFRAKGAVLRGAAAEVHALEPAARPLERPALEDRREELGEGDEVGAVLEADREDEVPRDYYRLEVTITPRPATGAFKLWEPGEVRLAEPGTKWDETDDACETYETEVFQHGSYQPDEGFKYGGPQRLRLLIGVRPGTERLVFRYYLEKFGEVRLRKDT
jgi:hypothetical protein